MNYKGPVSPDEVVNGLQVEQIIVSNVHTDAEVEASITTIDDFVVSKFNKIRVLCITH